MNRVKIIAFVCLGVLGAMVPQAKADEWNQKTIFTFNVPVEIPGQVLDPGTYVFKLLDSPSDRNIVQVFNKDENHLYGTLLAIPDYRLKPAGRPIITFEERAVGSPEFVYPKGKAVELAQTNNQPVASMPDQLEPQVIPLQQAPVMAQQPTGEEVEIAQVFAAPPAPPATNLPQELPKTASNLPVMLLFGLLSLGTAALLRRANSKGK